MRIFTLILLPLILLGSDFHSDKVINKNSAAVIKIFNYSVQPDYYTPWTMHRQTASSGSGVLIKGNYILTAAHVVSNSTYLEVQKSMDAKKYFAEVKWIAHDADLALLEVKSKDFFVGTTSLSIGELPKRQDGVAVYGYPTGGLQISITKGVISRIEQTVYAHSAIDLLSIQIDAAINPGNSGGPAFNKKGEIVGIAMQGLVASNSIGYIVPSPIINHFLNDIKDGTYDGFPDDGLYIQDMENSDLKAHYNMQKRTGVLITSVIIDSTSDGYLKKGDIILEVDGHKVNDDNSLKTKELQKIATNYVVKQHFIGEKIHFKILRDGKELDFHIPLKNRISKIPFEHEKRPRYYIYGGFMFTTLTQNYLAAWGKNWLYKAPIDFLYAFHNTDIRNHVDDEIVVLQRALHNRINAGYTPNNVIVKKVNGIRIHSLTELAQLIEKSTQEVIIETNNNTTFIIDVSKAKASEKSILDQYGIKVKGVLSSIKQ